MTLLKITMAVVAAFSAVLLSGCGDDRPVSGPPPGSDTAAQSSSAPPLAAATPSPAAQTPNPLLPSDGPADNPLLSSSHGNPLMQNNPLTSGNPLHGQTMPTDHSHWLRGRVRDARLTVLLNGIRQGEYVGVVDQDITMKLRRGVNTVSFVYAPRSTDASAQMTLVESEHNPPIPPLVRFQSAPANDATTSADSLSQTPAAQSFTFYAR